MSVHFFLSKQLKKMGRYACQEENNDNYNFFHILSNYMVDMDNVPEEKKSEEARAIIIGNISGDEKKFSRVRKVQLFLSFIAYIICFQCGEKIFVVVAVFLLSYFSLFRKRNFLSSTDQIAFTGVVGDLSTGREEQLLQLSSEQTVSRL